MPYLVRFLLIHGLAGFCLALALVAAMVAFDFGHLGSLLASTNTATIALLSFGIFLGLAFATIQVSMAVILLPKEDVSRFGGGHKKPIMVAAPAVARRKAGSSCRHDRRFEKNLWTVRRPDSYPNYAIV